ncbi:uncharacterized protein LOC135830687 [Sycon ciliatum]|uniref:uncharacterized protein LOC135830687 n=1 Tax=Sycon ciliatum TaxID=27933 RepID=UPI0031F6B82F
MAVSQDFSQLSLNLLKVKCGEYGLKKSGKKADLVARLAQHFSEGDGDGKEGPPPPAAALAVIPHDPLDFPVTGWQPIKSASGRLLSLSFSMQTMVSYFVDTMTSDGPAKNFKALAATDSKSIRLYRAGYVQKIELMKANSRVYYRARCQPEMKTKADYKLRLVAQCDSGSATSVVGAQCTCPAGKGVTASCKHIAALMYGLSEFTLLGFSDAPTCTDMLQKWNQPPAGAGKKSEPMLVQDMEWRRGGSTTDKSAPKKRKHSAAEVLDPRAVAKRMDFARRVEEYANSTIHSNSIHLALPLVAGSSGFAAKQKEDRLHRAQAQKKERLARAGEQKDKWQVEHSRSGDVTPVPSDCEWLTEDKQMLWYESNVILTCEEVNALQEATASQTTSELWRNERKKRITASIAHTVAHRRPQTDPSSLIKTIIDRPAFTTPATRWGIDHEEEARCAYVAHQAKSGKLIDVVACGLFVHADECWFGASPDGIVRDGDTSLLLEIKCPFVARDQSLAELFLFCPVL